jgi:hypothetical protein
MVDFSKVSKQVDDRKQGLAAVFGAAPAQAETPPAKATRNRKAVDGSKRTTWKCKAWYVQPETANRLRAYVNRQQEAGAEIDASDVVDQALQAWLSQQGS